MLVSVVTESLRLAETQKLIEDQLTTDIKGYLDSAAS